MIRLTLLSCAVLLTTPACGQTIVKTDRQWEGEGEYVIFASPWCSDIVKSLVQGRDYANSIRWQAGTLPNNIITEWRYPEPSRRPKECGVFGYNFVGWGNYHNSTPRKPIVARKVSQISELTFDYAMETSSDRQKFGILSEFFLTASANNFTHRQMEVGFLLQLPDEGRQFWKTQRQLGVFKDRWGVSWDVAQSMGGIAKSFVVFVPSGGGARMNGKIDAIGALKFLTAKKVADGNWWFNGAALGAEPLGGRGNATIRYFRPTYR